MDKIAVMGDYDSIYGFSAVGLTVFPVDMDGDMEEAARQLRRIAQGGYGVIFITEALAAKLKREVDRYAGVITPAIIQIPGVSGNTGAGVNGVKKSVEQAVGSDILFGDN